MKRSYLGAVCEDGGTYGIVFLDFPGCISAGDTLDDVLKMGAEALQGHIEVMLDAGELIASPSEHSLSDVQVWLDDGADQGGESWIGLYPIPVDVASAPASISVPVKAEIVREIAEIATRNLTALTSREFVEAAVRRELDRLKKSA